MLHHKTRSHSCSYKWAEVLSADAFSAFEEAGLEDKTAVAETGRRFRDTVLASEVASSRQRSSGSSEGGIPAQSRCCDTATCWWQPRPDLRE